MPVTAERAGIRTRSCRLVTKQRQQGKLLKECHTQGQINIYRLTLFTLSVFRDGVLLWLAYHILRPEWRRWAPESRAAKSINSSLYMTSVIKKKKKRLVLQIKLWLIKEKFGTWEAARWNKKKIDLCTYIQCLVLLLSALRLCITITLLCLDMTGIRKYLYDSGRVFHKWQLSRKESNESYLPLH